MTMMYHYSLLTFMIISLMVLVSSSGIVFCPTSCVCDLQVFMSSIDCSGKSPRTSMQTWSELLEVQKQHPLLKRLSYQGGLTSIPSFLGKFDELMHLNLSMNYITTIRRYAFAKNMYIRTLDLSSNGLETIEYSSFTGLEMLRTLNLSHNSIGTISENTFAELWNLRKLVLQQNRISILPHGIFKNLQKLEELDLSYNYLLYFSSQHFSSLLGLKKLYINSNLVQSLHIDTVGSLSHVPFLDLSNNPLDCSCALKPLKVSLTDRNTTLLNSDLTRCTTPANMTGQKIVDVPHTALSCSTPTIKSVSSSQVVAYQRDVYLPCLAEGSPTPAVIWETPWGDIFAHPSTFHLLGDASINYTKHHSYQGRGLMLVSTVDLFGNGTLHISKFRGYFTGNFTCIAVNTKGNSSSAVAVDIYHHMMSVYVNSFIMGGYVTVGGIVLGAIVSVVKMIVLAVQRKLKEKKEAEELTKSVSDVLVEIDINDDRSDPTPPKTPLLSPYSHTPNSPQKCTTPTSEDQTGWLPGNIIETLDEVRWRLRYGMGRKMEKVRCQVQSIKESSNLYMQSIRETSTSAAHRVRSGIVVGMETMKYSVQSMKEFCGTGDMGGQTVSTISVSTNVDTEQRTEVIKSITYV